ncbi:TPA: hypothetical protein VCC10_000258 [Streptococcus pyogenes]|nr:hypothetical protein [Streptococcus pyogenes]HEP2123674.1 hypothetical protein [Streptococcus pyogenes]HEP2191418.1 hypothetical protein [Streptococcus pyogenes]HEP2328164.1 hypothetical protein [Streptococcus pyogenes]
MGSEGLRLRIYINKHKKMIIAPDYNDRYGGISNTTIQLRTGKLTEVIEQEVGEAILDIIKKYEPIFDTPIIDDLFREKEQAIRKMVDYDTALTEMVEVEDENY